MEKCALMHFLDSGGNELPDKKSLFSIAKKKPRSTFLRFPERLSFFKVSLRRWSLLIVWETGRFHAGAILFRARVYISFFLFLFPGK